MLEHLTPDVSIAARTLMVTREIQARGYTIREGTHPTRSMANPITRVITLRAGALGPGSSSSVDLLALLAHEWQHVEQQAGGLARRLWWAARYAGLGIVGALMAIAGLPLAAVSVWLLLLVPGGLALTLWSDRFRLAVEIEAEAMELATRRAAGQTRAEPSHKLGGFRLPYLTLGSPARIDAEVEAQAEALLSRADR